MQTSDTEDMQMQGHGDKDFAGQFNGCVCDLVWSMHTEMFAIFWEGPEISAAVSLGKEAGNSQI